MTTKTTSLKAATGAGYMLKWTVPGNIKVTCSFKRNGSQQSVGGQTPSGTVPGTVNITLKRDDADADFDGEDPTATLQGANWVFSCKVLKASAGKNVYTLQSDAPGADTFVETVDVQGSALETYPDYMALPDDQKKSLSDYVQNGVTGSSDPRVKSDANRLSDAKDVATLMKDGGTDVGAAFADEVGKSPGIIPQLSRMGPLDWWKSPTWDGAAASGGDKTTTQQRLVRVISLLISRANGAGPTGKKILTNTIEHFMQGLPLKLGSKTGGAEALAQYSDITHDITVNCSSQLGITPASIQDPGETVKKLAHEVNHACRHGYGDTKGDDGTFCDEFYAYMTELLATGQTITEAQVDQTYTILRKAPYSLGKFMDGDVGKAWIAKLTYVDGGTYKTLNVGSIPKPTGGDGWSLDNHSN
jgi:hypothetical protein